MSTHYSKQAKILHIVETNHFKYMFELWKFLKKNDMVLYDYLKNDYDFALNVRRFMFYNRIFYTN